MSHPIESEAGADRLAALASTQRNVQFGPWPTELFELVVAPDSNEPHDTIRVRHLFPIPPAAYNRDAWQRWLFELSATPSRSRPCTNRVPTRTR